GPAFNFIRVGLPRQVSSSRLFDEGTIVGVDRGHGGLMVGWEIGAFVAELLPDVHIVPTNVPEVAVWRIDFPDADVGAAYGQLQAGVGQAEFLLGSPPAGDVRKRENHRIGSAFLGAKQGLRVDGNPGQLPIRLVDPHDHVGTRLAGAQGYR